MDETGFLELAEELNTGSRQADWRSAISRAYYAAFHKARSVFRQGGFRVPEGEQSHSYLWLRLSNSGHPDVANAGVSLNRLRSVRNRADYDFRQSFDRATAGYQVQVAEDLIQLLDDLAKEPTIFAPVVDAMKIYERDVLRDVTWHPS